MLRNCHKPTERTQERWSNTASVAHRYPPMTTTVMCVDKNYLAFYPSGTDFTFWSGQSSSLSIWSANGASSVWARLNTVCLSCKKQCQHKYAYAMNMWWVIELVLLTFTRQGKIKTKKMAVYQLNLYGMLAHMKSYKFYFNNLCTHSQIVKYNKIIVVGAKLN